MTTGYTVAPTYEECTRLAESGRTDEALEALQAYLREHPADAAALNDLGALLYMCGRFDEAAAHLEAARRYLTGPDGEVLWNLAEVYLAANRPRRALGLFGGLHEGGLLTADLANRTATRFLEAEDRDGAIEALLACRRILPGETHLGPFIDALRVQRPKVAFFCELGDANFLKDIARFTGERFQTRSFQALTDEQMFEALSWCDIAWFEWCTRQLVRATRMPKVCRIVCRLHRFEAYLDFPAQVRWENVDALVTIGNPAVMDHLHRTVPRLEKRTHVRVIPSAVDLDRWTLLARPRGKNIACLGYINQRKNPGFLLQCFWRLHAIDPRYRLWFGGQSQDPMLMQYLEHMVRELDLQDSVTFQGWVDDMVGWLDDKHYLVSTSLGEGLPASLLEGMARGLKPIIHTWPGARDFFPPEFLFRTPEEFCERILEGVYEPEVYRDWAARRYSLQSQLKQINDLFLELERSPWPPKDGQPPAAPKAIDGSTSPETRDPLAHYDEWYKDGAVLEGWPQRARREKVVETLAALGRRDLRIVDLGCGMGHLEPHLVRFGPVTAIDWSQEAVKAAEAHCPEAHFLCGDVRTVLLPRGTFDAVVSVEVIEHLSEQDQCRHLERARDLLVPGGLLILTTPNRPVMEALNRECLQRDGTPWSDQPIENWLDQETLRTWAAERGFSVERLEAFMEKGEHRGLHLLLVARRNDQA